MRAKTALVAIAKNEGAYLPEWIAHHLHFGFDEVHVWINGTTDNSWSIMAKISDVFHNVYAYDGDELLRKCQASGQNFQVAAYNTTLDILRSKDTTHMMSLDVDEFFVATSMLNSIGDFLRNDMDVVSFQWGIDEARYGGQPFSFPLASTSFRVQRNPHVKSVARISDRISGCEIHSFIVRDGRYALWQGTRMPGTSMMERAIVGDAIDAAHAPMADFAFVLHRMNRSPREYLASLLRGRAHALDGLPLKQNRHGFQNLRSQIVPVYLAQDGLAMYHETQRRFVEVCDLAKDIEIARDAVMSRANEVLSMAENPEIARDYRRMLYGVNLRDPDQAPAAAPRVTHSVDAVCARGAQEMVITGWVFTSDQTVRAPSVWAFARPWPHRIRWVERRDVAETHKFDNARCGFEIEVEFDRPVTAKDIELRF